MNWTSYLHSDISGAKGLSISFNKDNEKYDPYMKGYKRN